MQAWAQKVWSWTRSSISEIRLTWYLYLLRIGQFSIGLLLISETRSAAAGHDMTSLKLHLLLAVSEAGLVAATLDVLNPYDPRGITFYVSESQSANDIQ